MPGRLHTTNYIILYFNIIKIYNFTTFVVFAKLTLVIRFLDTYI